jgi:hypothetical protein
MAEPIIEFKDISQAYECLKEWQSRLFLDDWIIQLEIAEVNSLEVDGSRCVGTNEYNHMQKMSCIQIEKIDKNLKTSNKICHEQTLVHELLHCKYGFIYTESYEGKYLEATEHQLLESMAKSFIMAKYNLTFEWFKNF